MRGWKAFDRVELRKQSWTMKWGMRALALGFAGFGLLSLDSTRAATSTNSWPPKKAPLMTKWAKDVSPVKSHPEYPRPQLVRKEWLNLNGLWDFAITQRNDPAPQEFQAQILVPFPVESSLSGVMQSVFETNRVWYHRRFEIPKTWGAQRVLLHFGAVDFEARVWVNGREIGSHRGGYDPFRFEITDALSANGTNDIVVSAWDPTDASPYSRGKQVRKPDQGIFYTATSGIWQTVWLEPVPEVYISNLRITPDVDGKKCIVQPIVNGAGADHRLDIVVSDKGREVARADGTAGRAFELELKYPRLWSPELPDLYDLTVALRHGDQPVDSVTSYFGMRKVSLGKDTNGITRIFLNNQPFFMLGPLDQGFWPDGLYTAPTDEALRSDIEVTKKLGFNMARKHVKVEPDTWYFWCDKLGLLVWQDMPSGDKFIGAQSPDIERTTESARQFETELKAMIDTHYNHPSIVMWVIFNEGWGQFDTKRLTDWAKEYDPTRLINNASGWADRKVGDVNDIHRYPGPGSPNPEDKRAAVLGEFGGLGFKVDGHTWAGKTWGYRGMENVEKLTRVYTRLFRKLYALKEVPGLSAAVYTQTTDVEYEGNGLLTYDREVIKMKADDIASANRGHFLPEPKLAALSPTAQEHPVQWRYTTEKPPTNWAQPDFNDRHWKEGPSGFGVKDTPGAIIGTEWKGPDIWLRREFTLHDSVPRDVRIMIHHDDDAEVYVNGVQSFRSRGYTTEYEEFDAHDETLKALIPGKNVLAVHCHQVRGGQYIDVGLYRPEK